jgi:LPXTG-motif cell wall-anchored protein
MTREMTLRQWTTKASKAGISVMLLGAVLATTPLGATAAVGDDAIDIEVTKSHVPDPGLRPGDAVMFTIEIENLESYPIRIDSIVDDQVPGANKAICDGPDGGPGSEGLIGSELAAGATATCSYTLTDYAPAAGESRTNTVDVGVSAQRPDPEGDPWADRLVISENGIDNATFLLFDSPSATDAQYQVKTWSSCDVNDDSGGCPHQASSNQRSVLSYFSANVGQHISFFTGGFGGKEALFTLTRDYSEQTDQEFAPLGPTTNGYRNFFGDPFVEPHHDVGCGLGNACMGFGPEQHLDKVPTNIYGVQDYYSAGDGRAYVRDLFSLQDKVVCALAKDDDVSFDKGKGHANYQGDYLGTVAFKIIRFDPTWKQASSYNVGDWNRSMGETSDKFFPAWRVEILDADVCDDVPTVTITGTGQATDTVTTPVPRTGSITLDKVTTGDGQPAAETEFTFGVLCDSGTVVDDDLGTPGINEVSIAPQDAPRQIATGVLVGDTCTITETDAAGAVATTWTVDGSPGTPGTSQVVRVSEVDQVVSVVATNAYRTPPPPPPETFAVELTKVNDANGDGTFSDRETAPAEGSDVTFEIDIINTGSGALTLQSLTDAFDDELVDLLVDVELSCTGSGGAVVVLEPGSLIPAGTTIRCRFTLAGYAPAAGDPLVNTVTVVTVEADPADDVSEVDSERPAPSVVPRETRSPGEAAPAAAGAVISRPLPRTGSETGHLTAAGLALLGLGALLTISSELRRRQYRA